MMRSKPRSASQSQNMSVPSVAIAIWPWTLTQLTARVMGAMFALGVAGLGAPSPTGGGPALGSCSRSPGSCWP